MKNFGNVMKIKTMEKIAEKQKTEKKEPIVLKDPAKSYHPEGNKTNLPITTTTPSSGGASLGGVFGKNISEKVSEKNQPESKETESTPEEPKTSETEKDEKDETEKTETTETETKTSPEKTGEKVSFSRPKVK